MIRRNETAARPKATPAYGPLQSRRQLRSWKHDGIADDFVPVLGIQPRLPGATTATVWDWANTPAWSTISTYTPVPESAIVCTVA